MPRPGSTVSRGRGSPAARHCRVHDLAQALRQLLDLGGVVLLGVGDAEPAAQVQLGDLDAVLVADPDGQVDHPVRGHLETGRVEDLRADVRVQPGERQAGQRDDPPDRLVGGPGGQREAELLVVVRGGHELVGVRLDPGGDPDQDVRLGLAVAVRWPIGQVSQPGDLLERVRRRCGPRRPRPRGTARPASCCCRAWRSAPAAPRPTAPPRARRRCRRRRRGPPRSSPSAAPRGSRTPWPRRTPARPGRTPPGTPGSATGRPPRRRRTAACRTRRPGPARPPRRSSAPRPDRRAPRGQMPSCSAFRSAGAAGGWSAGSTSPWRGPAGCATRLMEFPS